MLTKRRRLGGAAAIAALAVVLAACGGSSGGGTTSKGSGGSAGFGDCKNNPNTCNGGDVEAGGSITYTIEKDISNWNLNSVDGNTFDFQEALDGIVPTTFISNPDLSLTLNKDLLVSAEQTSDNPQTFVYKIQPDAVWSDGEPINADDFIYEWKTSNGKDCPDCASASTAGYDQIKSVEGSDNGKTVTVVMNKIYPDWKGLFGYLYPAHIAKQKGDLNTPKGLAAAFDAFGKAVPTWSGGPYVIDKFQSNVAVTEKANPKYYGKKPNLDTVVFRIITDSTQEPTALSNGEVQAIYPQPQVDLVNQVKNIPDVYYNIGFGPIWEHFDLNLKNPALQDLAVRQAIFTAVDRKQIIDKTVGQFSSDAKPINNHNFVPGQPGYKDVLPKEQGSGDTQAAIKTLTDAGYKIQGGKLIMKDGKPFPTLRIRYTVGNQIRQNECELFKAMVKPLGIDVTIQTTDKLGGTLSSGDYDVIVFAWVGTPFPISGAYQLWLSTSDSNYGHWVNKESDSLLQQANNTTDNAKSNDLLNQADEIMSKDAYVLPLYQKPTFFAIQKKFANMRDNPTSVGPPYNIGEWGVRKSGS